MGEDTPNPIHYFPIPFHKVISILTDKISEYPYYVPRIICQTCPVIQLEKALHLEEMSLHEMSVSATIRSLQYLILKRMSVSYYSYTPIHNSRIEYLLSLARPNTSF